VIITYRLQCPCRISPQVRVQEREFDTACARLPAHQKAQLQTIRRFRDSLPHEARGTRDAFLLRQQQRRRQQQSGPQAQRQRQQ
jgi:acyl-CoA synthetase (AMP-forming)/AMP-acid ligase II